MGRGLWVRACSVLACAARVCSTASRLLLWLASRVAEIGTPSLPQGPKASTRPAHEALRPQQSCCCKPWLMSREAQADLGGSPLATRHRTCATQSTAAWRRACRSCSRWATRCRWTARAQGGGGGALLLLLASKAKDVCPFGLNTLLRAVLCGRGAPGSRGNKGRIGLCCEWRAEWLHPLFVPRCHPRPLPFALLHAGARSCCSCCASTPRSLRPCWRAGIRCVGRGEGGGGKGWARCTVVHHRSP